MLFYNRNDYLNPLVVLLQFQSETLKEIRERILCLTTLNSEAI